MSSDMQTTTKCLKCRCLSIDNNKYAMIMTKSLFIQSETE